MKSMSVALSSVVMVVGSIGCARESELIDVGSLRVVPPDPGERVWAEVLRADGATEWLDVLVDDEGHAHVEHEFAVASAQSAGTSPLQCNDAAFSLMGHAWQDRLDWWFKASTTPAELTVTAAETALVKASDNIVRGRNSCSLSDQIGATHLYRGRTSTATQVRADGGCNARDGKNVVAFGDLPAGVLAVACVWSTADGVALESDIRVNSGDFFWTTAATSDSCEDEFDLESVVTHERGHSFGLGHVSESNHMHLTMSTMINGPCQRAEVTLGRGDVMALRELY